MHPLQNTYCQACGSFEFEPGEAPWRCSACPQQFHRACLTGKERGSAGRPGARWVCPLCARHERLGRGIDAILACRGGGTGKEYRIKFAGRSHLHTEWVRVSELEAAAALFPGLRLRLKTFEKKRAAALLTQVGAWGGRGGLGAALLSTTTA